MEKKFQQAIREKDQLQKQIDVIILFLIFYIKFKVIACNFSNQF
jgi:hypothetical protein